MPTKSKTSKSTKSRVSSKAKKATDKKLFIALGVLVIAIVAVVGILWYRDSQAGTALRYVGSAGWRITGISRGSHVDMEWMPNTAIKARATMWGRYNSGVQKYILRSSSNIGGRDKCVYIGPQNHTLDSAIRFKADNRDVSQKYFVGQKVNVLVTDSCYE